MPSACTLAFLQLFFAQAAAAPVAGTHATLPAEQVGASVEVRMGNASGQQPPTARSLAAPDGAPAAEGAAAAPLARAADALIDLTNIGRAPVLAAVQAASYAVEIGDGNRALRLLGALDSPAAALLRARARRLVGDARGAAAALVQARRAPELGPLIDVELAKLAVLRGDWPRVVGLLLPLLHEQPPLAASLVPLLAQAQVIVAPLNYLQKFDGYLALLAADDHEMRSCLWERRAQAQERLGRTAEASQARLGRYLYAPVASTTPLQPPPGTVPSTAQQVERIDRLVAAHRNERALLALEALALPEPVAAAANGRDPNLSDPNAAAPQALLCRAAYLHGLAARKLRRYAVAEAHCDVVLRACAAQPDLVRQAAFLRAKVVSIRDGLRAIPAIDAFAAEYPDHSMADDVLFWAGDMYQRRGDPTRASAYYRRIDALPMRGDFCAEARWRLAWMAWRQPDLPAAEEALQRLLRADGCVRSADEVARAHFWLGRLKQQQGQAPQAAQSYARAIAAEPHGFYAQSALPPLLALQKSGASLSLGRGMMAPPPGAPPRLCAFGLGDRPEFSRALLYLRMGLGADAATQLLALPTHPPAALFAAADLARCGPAQAALLVVLLQQKAGADRQAYSRLRRAFGDNFGAPQSPDHMVLWRAAYPLAFRGALAHAEAQSRLPNLFLQALAREESAFDPKVVSWAEAYGLTQMLLSSARDAGRMLRPPRTIAAVDELLDPQLNAELGGALFASMARRVGGSLALGLVSYNAGNEQAALLRRRFAGQDFMTFAEEVHIAETRAYVKRVLRTFGTYRWLYATALPSLPIEPLVP